MNKTAKRQERPLGRRHETNCKVCLHSERQEIETQFIGWANTSKLAKDYGLSRDSLYRHAHALGLFEKGKRYLRAALERIVEQADSVQVNASAIVSAAQALAKINAADQWVDRTEAVNLNALFEKMSEEELQYYAENGELPDWFKQIVGATPNDSHEENRNG